MHEKNKTRDVETWNRLIAIGGEEGGGNGGKKGKGLKNMYEQRMDVDNGEGIDCGQEGWAG